MITNGAHEPRGAFFVAGGTVPPGSRSYVERRADRELYAALSAGEYCYVLNSRQMGKSSLAVRTIARLKEEGVWTSFVDLTRIGSGDAGAERWFSSLLLEFGRALGIRDRAVAVLKEDGHETPTARLLTFLRDEALRGREERIVVFIDEVDATRSLPFSTDALFAAIRQCWNARAIDPAMARLSFCLMGAALPSDLIRDPRITPFNVGRRIDLSDFSLEEAQPLALGLGRQGETALRAIMDWTGGHPYLTQTLGEELASKPKDVSTLVRKRYLEARDTDSNLVDVGNRLLGRGDPSVTDRDRADTLDLYARMLKRGVPDDEANPAAARIKMSGVARVEDGVMRVRNRIYAHAFDRTWIAENTPGHEIRRQRRAFWRGALRTGAISAVVVSAIGGLAFYNFRLRNAAEASEQRAKASEARANYEAYISSMRLLPDLWEQGSVEGIRRILDRYRESPYRGWEWDYWYRQTGGDLYTLETQHGIPRLSPDGKLIACRVGSKIKLLDSETLRLKRELTVPGTWMAADWTPDGKLLTTITGFMGVMALIDPQDGRILRRLKRGYRFEGNVQSSSPDGRYRAGGNSRFQLSLYDFKKNVYRPMPSLGRTAFLGGPCVFSPDGASIAVGTGDLNDEPGPSPTPRGVVLFQAGSLRRVGFLPTQSSVGSIAYSPDGRWMAVGMMNGDLALFDVRTGRSILLPKVHPYWVESISFSSDGRYLISFSFQRIGEVFRVANGRLDHLLSIPGPSRAEFIAGTHRLVASFNHTWIFDLDKALVPVDQSHPPFADWSTYCAIVGDTILTRQTKVKGGTIYASDTDGRMPLHEADRAPEFDTFDTRTGLVALHRGQTLVVRDPLKKHDVGVFPGIAECTRFSVDARRRRAAAMVTGNEVAILDLGGQRVLRRFEVSGGLNDLALSADGRRLALGRDGGTIEMTETETGRTVWTCRSNAPYAIGLVFSRDDRYLAFAGEDTTATIVDAAGGRFVSLLEGHSQTVQCIDLSPDDRRVVTASPDGTVRVWDTATGQEAATLATHLAFTRVAFSADGSAIYGISQSGRIHVWSAR